MALRVDIRLCSKYLAALGARRGISTSAPRAHIREIKDAGYAPKFKDQFVRDPKNISPSLITNGRLVHVALASIFYYWYLKDSYISIQEDTETWRRVNFERTMTAKGQGLPEPVYIL